MSKLHPLVSRCMWCVCVCVCISVEGGDMYICMGTTHTCIIYRLMYVYIQMHMYAHVSIYAYGCNAKCVYVLRMYYSTSLYIRFNCRTCISLALRMCMFDALASTQVIPYSFSAAIPKAMVVWSELARQFSSSSCASYSALWCWQFVWNTLYGGPNSGDEGMQLHALNK